MKKWLIVLIVVVAVVVGLGIAKDLIAQAAVTGGVQALTGLRVRMDRLHVGLLRQVVHVQGLRVLNPDGFQDPVMVDLPELYVDYDLGALLTGKVHLKDVRVHLRQLIVAKNNQGELNLASVPVVQQQQQAKPAGTPSSSGKPMALLIDRLHLQIGTVVFKDASPRAMTREQQFPINLDEQYANITHPEVLASLILTKALAKTTIARLTGLDVGALGRQAGAALTAVAGQATEVARQATQTATQATRGLQSAAGQTAGAAKQAAGRASETVGETAGQVGDALKKFLPGR